MQARSFFVLYLAILGLSWVAQARDCPNNCSGANGRCNTLTGVCQCVGNWNGDDCSILITPLSPNRPTTGHAEFRNWIYYTFESTGNAFQIRVTQPNREGDVDVYVRKNERPDAIHYDFADLTTEADVTIDVPANNQATRWYVGLYGFQSTDYTITLVTRSSTCPEDCSGHGQCSNNECVCAAGWAGRACDTAIEELQPNQWTPQVTLEATKWKYYHMRVAATSANRLTLSVIMNSGDADLYVKYGGLPSQEDWDYADAGVQLNTTMVIETPQPGDWYFGLYGYAASTPFTFRVLTAVAECPNQCSGSTHGTCNGVQCRCNNGFSGTTCETYNQLIQFGQSYQGHVDGGEWNYWKVQSGTSNNMVVSLTQNDRQDCDLYINSGALPTRFQYQYRHTGIDKDSVVRIDNPGSQLWWIGVFGFTNCDYTFNVSIGNSCPRCVNGNCDAQGRCICSPGFGGEQCDVPVVDVQNGQKVQGSVTSNEWRYYKFTTTASSIQALVKETTTRGQVWLFVSLATAPSLASYDYADQALNTGLHKVAVNLASSRLQTYIIGVYGNPFAEHTVNYQLAVWSPPF